MNLFYTSNSYLDCAKSLDDKRVVKMVLETAQMLSAACARHGATPTYKVTHKNHPCTLWVGDNKENYKWALQHFYCLGQEYTHRYGRRHKSLELFVDLTIASKFVPEGKWAEPPACTPGVTEGTTIERYQAYMCEKWLNDKRRPAWTNRSPPSWAVNVKGLQIAYS